MFLGVFLISICIAGYTAGDSVCSRTQRNASLSTCLDTIRAISQHDDYFYYGQRYFTRCPPMVRMKPECAAMNPDPNRTSLVNKIFDRGTFNPAALDRFIDVKYVSRPGSYYGCGHNYSFDATSMFNVDPALNTSYKPWLLRDFPDLQWDTTPSDLYTLLLIDTGNGFRHGIYINIQGNNVTGSEVLEAYNGPKNMGRAVANPYAFILLKQPGVIDPSQEWRNLIANPMNPFNISLFRQDHNLAGPVALNWVLAWHDPYSAEYARNLGFVENCPPFVQEKMPEQNRPFLRLQEGQNLEVYLEVKITSTPVTFESCCNRYSYGSQVFQLDPIGNAMVTPVHARTNGTSQIYQLTPRVVAPSNPAYFNDRWFTLVIVDPDVPLAAVGNNSHPLLHTIIMNIQQGNVTLGDTMVPYNGPMPPDLAPHSYYFLLYEQPAKLNTSIWSSYGGNCVQRLMGRCLWDVSRFAAENSLTLTGATWMVSKNDEFVNHTRIVDRGGSEADWCHNRPNYPCISTTQPTSSANYCRYSQLMFSCLLLTVSWFFYYNKY